MRFIPLRNLVKSCLVKYFKWLQKVIKANGLQRAHFAFRPDHKGHIKSAKGTVSLGRGLARTLIHWLE